MRRINQREFLLILLCDGARHFRVSVYRPYSSGYALRKVAKKRRPNQLAYVEGADGSSAAVVALTVRH